MANARPFVQGRLTRNQVVVFSKSYSPEGKICQKIFKRYELYLPDDIFEWVNFEKRSDCTQVEDYLWLLSGKNNREVPLLFIQNRFMGGYEEIMLMHQQGRLAKLLKSLKLEESDDEEEDLVRTQDISQITVRIEPLDDSELLVRVINTVNLTEHEPDWDIDQEDGASAEVRQQLRAMVEEADEDSRLGKSHRQYLEFQEVGKEFRPEWSVISGPRRVPKISVPMCPETASFIMKRKAKSVTILSTFGAGARFRMLLMAAVQIARKKDSTMPSEPQNEVDNSLNQLIEAKKKERAINEAASASPNSSETI